MIALAELRTPADLAGHLDALYESLADAENQALQVKRLTLAINALILEPQSQGCVVVMAERLAAIAGEATATFEGINRHLGLLIGQGAV
jgi:hypothetical protein